MESKKINQLATNLAPVNTDLTVIGDPLTGELKKITLLQIASIFGVGIGSIGMVVPSGFSVSPSTLTANGTFTISGAGTTAQYIRGDGSLATFPTFLSSDKLIQEVRNNSGATMLKGTIVYIDGAVGNKATIAKALASSDATSAQTYGVVQDDIANNSNGYIVIVGEVTGLDTSAVTEGQQLYLSGSIAGFYTVTKPYAPIHLVYVAIVLRSHPTLGILGVKIQNGYEMDELHNVDAVSPSNNDGLFYNTTTSLWEHKPISTVLGYTPVTSARTISTTSPLSGGGDLTADRTLSIAQATTSVSGYLSSIDFTTFNSKFNLPSLTSGSVLFSNGTTIAQDNANFFWDDTNNRLGIGTAIPSAILHTVGSVTASSAIARGNYMQPTLVAAANNDVLIGLDINPTFNTGAFTGVTGYGLRVRTIASDSTNVITIGTPTSTSRGFVLDMANSLIKGLDLLRLDFTANFLDFRYNPSGSATTFGRFFTSGNFALQNGGAFTDGGQRLQVTGTSYFSDSVQIGSNSIGTNTLRVGKNITGATTLNSVLVDGSVQSDVTADISYIVAQTRTAAATFNVTNSFLFRAAQASIGAGSTIGTQVGFYAEASLTGATNNYGFLGGIAAGTGRWNLYMSGTANNYMAGSLGIGSTSLTVYNLRILKNISGGTIALGIGNESVVQSDVTTQARYYDTTASTANTTFTLNQLFHYRAGQGTFGASSTVSNQVGFSAEASLIGAGFNVGFQGSIPSGTNRWNLYMAGTANNYLAGNLLIGTTTDAGYMLDVNGTARVSSDMRINGLTIGRGGGNISSNTALGSGALSLNVSGTNNVAVGVNALSKTTASNNVGIGISALLNQIGGSSNVAIGTAALSALTSGTGNIGIGVTAANAITTQGDNIAIGNTAMLSAVTSGCVAIGSNALKTTTGTGNTAIGLNSLRVSTSGANNTALGSSSLDANTTGASNVALGNSALFSNTTGSSNIAIGIEAARFISGGATASTIQNNSIFIGSQTRPLADSQTNQIVIGYQETGLCSNTTIIGISSTTLTALRGSVVTGATAANASAILQADSTTKGFLPPRMTTTQKNAIATPATGLMVFDTTLVKLCVYSGTAWQTITSI